MPSMIAAKIWLAGLVIFLERAAEAFLRPLMLAGLVVLALLCGLPQVLGDAARSIFWLVALGGLAVLVWPVRRLRWPSRDDAISRLEQDSGLAHRPLSALQDRLVAGEPGLWAAHQARLRRYLANTRWPRPGLSFATADPFALRNGLMLVLITAFALRGPIGIGEFRASLPQIGNPAAQLQVDGWIMPPTYIGKPPVVLAQGSVRQMTEIVRVPQGSVLYLRLAHANKPKLIASDDDMDEQELAFTEQGGSAFEIKWRIDRSASFALSDGWRRIGNWQIEVTADARPVAEIAGPAIIDKAGQITLPFEARDDYGLARVTLRFGLADEQEDGEGISGAAPFLAKPPELAAQFAPKSTSLTSRISGDLTKHAWAGLVVEAWIDAEDGAGQHGISNRIRMRLPERNFLHPMAKALSEQRRNLLRDSDSFPSVVAALDALAAWPQGVLDDSGRYLELRAITAKLYRALDADTIHSAAEDLWNLAIALEGGDLNGAKLSLEQARKLLEEALARGADEAEIAKLIQDFKTAMEKYLSALADANRRGELSQQADRKPDRLVSPQELSRMLEQMQELSRKGSKDEARDLLSQLDQMLKNLQMGQAAEGDGDAAMMRELGKLMRGQQQLMDRTYRMPQPGESGQQESGQGSERGEQGLSRQQDELGRSLGRLMDEMGDRGLMVPDALGQAREHMGKAGEALGAPDRDQALANQQQALNALKKGFDQTSRELMGEGQGEPGSQAREGEASGEDDPLGRPRATRGPEYGSRGDILPGEAAVESVRRILEELRARRDGKAISPVERDYLERLLRGLY